MMWKLIDRKIISVFGEMSKSLTTAALVIFWSVSSQGELNLSLLSPAPMRLSGVDFPRQDMILYRGVQDAQYNYVVAVAAMLGDERYNLESAMFRSVRELLIGRNAILFTRIAGLKEEFLSQNIMRLIDSRKVAGGMSSEDAIRNTKEILDQAYNAAFARTRAIDYASGSRNDNPTAFVYTTIHFEVARLYSPNLVLIKEKRSRSLDMNYWNKINNGKWVHTNRSYPDRGEFLTPFFLSASDIVGFQLGRKSFDPDWTVWRPVLADLDLVFMKQVVDGVQYVLVFDGSGLQHIVQEGETFCSARTRFDYSSEVPRMPEADCSVKPALYGVLRLCPSPSVGENNCVFPHKLFKNYKVSENANYEILNKISTHEFPSGDVVVFSRFAVDAQSPSTTPEKLKNRTDKDTPTKVKK